MYVSNVTAKKEYDSSYDKLAIGGNWATSTSHVGGSFAGDIATFNVYNTALDSTTIASNYAASVGKFVEVKPPVSFRITKVNDEDYTEGTTIPTGERVTVEVVVENAVDGETYELIGAVTSDRLYSVALEKITTNSQQPITLTLDVPAGDENAKVNIMLWGGFNKIVPLCDTIQL